MKKLLLFVCLSGFFSGNILGQATDLIISEYAEGSSNNKYIEIYNGTGDSVNLDNYQLWLISNGGAWAETINQLTGWIQDGDVLVVANSSADPIILAANNATTAYNSATFFNGDDAVGLAKDNGSATFVLIDAVGKQGVDPGTGWDVAGVANATGEHTLVRKPDVCSPDTNWILTAGTTPANSQWIVLPQNTWDSVGAHTMNCASGPAQIDLPITWDDTANVDYTTTPFGGNFSALALDPTDPTNNVLEVIKPGGAQTWAGVTLSTPAGLASDIPFTVVENKISAKVYSPAVGMTVKLKAEVVGSPAQSVETDMLTTVANTWETLVFNFTNNSPSTPAINYALDYNLLSIFFDFNVPGANDTFYCDSVYFGGNVPTPEFNFTSSDLTTEEADAATYELIYTCNNLGADTAMVEVAIDGASTAMLGADFTSSLALPLTVTALPFQTTTDTITITIVNETVRENPENVVFLLQNPTNALIGDDNEIEITINDDDNFYPIPVINNDDANGEPDSLGNTYWTTGVVLGVDLDGNNGLSFTLWDEEGINIFNFVDVSDYVVTEGDSLLVRGEIDFYNGLTELFVDSIVVLNTGNPVPAPMIVSAPGQMTESEPIKINSVQVIDAGEWPSGGSSNVRLLTCAGDTIIMRIDSDTDVDDNWAVAPTGLFNVTGIGGQFDNSAPYLENYQIFPMYFTDIDTMTMPAPSLVINELMAENATAYQDENGDNDDWIELYNSSASSVSLAGLYLTNDNQDLTKFQVSMMSTETVAAGGYVIVWADNETTEGDLHTNFELDAAGDYVGLAYMNGCTPEIVDEIDYTALAADESFGRETDGNEPWVVFTISTPNAMNEYIVSVEELNTGTLKAWPNPNKGEALYFNQKVSFSLYSLTGQMIMSGTDVSCTDLSGLDQGFYLIETTSGETFRVVVK